MLGVQQNFNSVAFFVQLVIEWVCTDRFVIPEFRTSLSHALKLFNTSYGNEGIQTDGLLISLINVLNVIEAL